VRRGQWGAETGGGKVSREYPERPVVGVGGVVIEDGRALLIRRGSEPLLGKWSIPGGTLELGESLEHGVVRELKEETALDVRILEMIEVFDRIYEDQDDAGGEVSLLGVESKKGRPRYHYVIIDYLCERIDGEAKAGSDVTDVAYATEDEFVKYGLTETATRILRKAFAMERARRTA
jgi:ADP-ribose pyrophosphatase YjhB (NUDIX family)